MLQGRFVRVMRVAARTAGLSVVFVPIGATAQERTSAPDRYVIDEARTSVPPLTTQTAGESAPARAGFWASGGPGGGVSDEASAGFGLYLRMGGTVSDHVLVGGEVLGIVDSSASVVATLGNVTASAMIDPGSPGGWLLKAGVGVASFTTRVKDLDFTGTDEGFGITLGIGNDIRIGSNLWLTPNVDILVQSFDGFADSTIFMATLGLGIQ